MNDIGPGRGTGLLARPYHTRTSRRNRSARRATSEQRAADAPGDPSHDPSHGPSRGSAGARMVRWKPRRVQARRSRRKTFLVDVGRGGVGLTARWVACERLGGSGMGQTLLQLLQHLRVGFERLVGCKLGADRGTTAGVADGQLAKGPGSGATHQRLGIV